jgi:predicted metal-dependent hydrolase
MPILTHQGTEIPYTIVRSARRRRTVSISVDGQHGVRIRAPLRLSQAAIAQFAAARAGWIATRLQQLPPPLPAVAGLDGRTVFVRGVPHPVRIEQTQLLTRHGFCRAEDSALVIALPDAASSPDQNRLAEAALVAWYRREAAVDLTNRTGVWAERLQLRPTAVRLSAAKTRWGSCSADNIIRYSWQLITLPPALIDAVVVHELCHIREKNHGPAFWALVAAALPGWRADRQRLRQDAPQYLFRPVFS